MVTQKSNPKWPFGKPIGHIRVSGRQLIDLLKVHEASGVGVTAETEKHSFDSIDDMEQNISLLQGETTVKLRPGGDWNSQVDVKFGYCTVVDTGFRSTTDLSSQKVFLQRLEADLRSIRTPLIWPFTIVPRFLWLSVLGGVLIGDYFAEPDQPGSKNNGLSVTEAVVLTAIFLSGVFSWVKPVHYARSDTFWMRNKDKIIVGVSMLILGALMTHFAPQFFSGDKP